MEEISDTQIPLSLKKTQTNWNSGLLILVEKRFNIETSFLQKLAIGFLQVKLNRRLMLQKKVNTSMPAATSHRKWLHIIDKFCTGCHIIIFRVCSIKYWLKYTRPPQWMNFKANTYTHQSMTCSSLSWKFPSRFTNIKVWYLSLTFVWRTSNQLTAGFEFVLLMKNWLAKA